MQMHFLHRFASVYMYMNMGMYMSMDMIMIMNMKIKNPTLMSVCFIYKENSLTLKGTIIFFFKFL